MSPAKKTASPSAKASKPAGSEPKAAPAKKKAAPAKAKASPHSPAKAPAKKTPAKPAAKAPAKKKAPKASSKAALQKRAAAIVPRLAEHYPDNLESALDSKTAFEKLVATMLSAQCTDARVNLTTPALFAEFPDASAMAGADIDRVKELIRSINFFNNKAKAVVNASKIIVEKHGGQVPGDLNALVELPGVGRKTAWCVLDEYFGQPGLIVDTHLKRVAARLGLHEEEDPVKIEMALGEIVPVEMRRTFTHGLTHHGRATCAARKPKCAECFLSDLCPSAEA